MNNMKVWDQAALESFDGEDGGVGVVTQQEFIKAMESYGVPEDQAKIFFSGMKSAAGQKNEEGISFKKGLSDSEQNAIAKEFHKQATKLNAFQLKDNAINAPGAFEKIDTNGDGEINRQEFIEYVTEKMPGGDLIDREDAALYFDMLATIKGDPEAGEKAVITKDEWETKDSKGKSVTDVLQETATQLVENPPTSEEKYMKAMEKMIETLEEMIQKMQDNAMSFAI